MSIGLTREELESRNNDSLIKYIGVLQNELKLIYDTQFPSRRAATKERLDFVGPDTLKCSDEEDA